MGIHDELVKLESEMAALEGMRSTNPVAFQKKLVQINSELSELEKVIAKQGDEEDDWDGDDSDDNGGAGDDDDDDGDDDEFDNPGRKRLLNTGEPMQYRPNLDKAYGNSSSNGSPLPVTSKWEAVVQNLSNEHGIPLSTASVMARKQFPRLYQTYQESGLQGNAARTHQALVTAEMDKGFSEIVAKQRVAHAYGSTPADITKFADSPVTRFNAVVTKLMEERGIERTEALRLARKRNPALFAKFQEV
jgi:hypothetical protein